MFFYVVNAGVLIRETYGAAATLVAVASAPGYDWLSPTAPAGFRPTGGVAWKYIGLAWRWLPARCC